MTNLSLSKQITNIKKLRNSMNELAKTLGTFQVIGKRQTIVHTKDVQMSVQKVSSPSELANLSISTAPHDTEGSRVEMPMTFLNGSGLGAITVTVSQNQIPISKNMSSSKSYLRLNDFEISYPLINSKSGVVGYLM